jgi:hypothetical protein
VENTMTDQSSPGSDPGSWTRVELPGVVLEVPAGLVSEAGQGAEGAAAVLEGGGLRVVVDTSLFADPLTGHAAQPGFRTWSESVDGSEREVVAFGDAGGRVVATRLPGVTATVRLTEATEAGMETALRILRSVRRT